MHNCYSQGGSHCYPLCQDSLSHSKASSQRNSIAVTSNRIMNDNLSTALVEGKRALPEEMIVAMGYQSKLSNGSAIGRGA